MQRLIGGCAIVTDAEAGCLEAQGNPSHEFEPAAMYPSTSGPLLGSSWLVCSFIIFQIGVILDRSSVWQGLSLALPFSVRLDSLKP